MVKKILIVDDEYDIVEPLAMLLGAEGFTVASVTKGEQTVKKTREFRPDLILLDILMSGSDGRTICKNIKCDPELQNITVIMMSAHPTAERDSAGCGADGFIAKPFSTDSLIELIKKY